MIIKIEYGGILKNYIEYIDLSKDKKMAVLSESVISFKKITYTDIMYIIRTLDLEDGVKGMKKQEIFAYYNKIKEAIIKCLKDVNGKYVNGKEEIDLKRIKKYVKKELKK